MKLINLCVVGGEEDFSCSGAIILQPISELDLGFLCHKSKWLVKL